MVQKKLWLPFGSSCDVLEDGSMALLVKCLGLVNVDLYRAMDSYFVRRNG